mgnify:CR=1 FL=1
MTARRSFTIMLLTLGFGLLGFGLGRLTALTERVPDARAVVVHQRNPLLAAVPTDLPGAWRTATSGLGSLRLTDDPAQADIVIVLLPGSGDNLSWPIGNGRRASVIHVGSEAVQRFGVAVVLHEIAHLWCCDVAGVPDGHWLDDLEPGLLNATRFGYETGRFSPRELRSMRLRP